MFKSLSLLIFIFSILYIPIIVYYVSLLQERDQIRNEVLACSIVFTPAPSPTPIRSSQLPEIVESNFGEYGTDYAVVIKNLKTGEEYKFNENKKYNSASFYKLWIMATAFQKIKDGTFKEDQIITGNQKKFDETLTSNASMQTQNEVHETKITEEAKHVSMKLVDAIDKMIIYSDNYSALLVAAKEGSFSVTNFLKNNGFKDSKFTSPPKTTANDIALYFEKLYKGEIVDKESSLKMLEILKKQAINDRIPAKLPKDIIVAHKTGELFGGKHDGGIVFNKKGDYVIVVMSDTKNPKIAVEKIAKFSEDIFNYFNTVD